MNLDSFVIIPDHGHGIAYIDHAVGDGRDRPAGHEVETVGESGWRVQINVGQGDSRIRQHPGFRWQRSFHDSIIGGTESLWSSCMEDRI